MIKRGINEIHLGDFFDPFNLEFETIGRQSIEIGFLWSLFKRQSSFAFLLSEF